MSRWWPRGFLFSRNRVTAKLLSISVNDSFTTSLGSTWLSQSMPTAIPAIPPTLPHRITRQSTRIRVRMMISVAAPMPTLWIAKENTLASWGSTPNTLVKTGKATAPPPRLVAPATREPNTMVRLVSQWAQRLLNACSGPCWDNSQIDQTGRAGIRIVRKRRNFGRVASICRSVESIA